MKRSSSAAAAASKAKSLQKNGNGNDGDHRAVIDWEVRPGGLLVQKRGPGRPAAPAGPTLIEIKVSHYSNHLHVTVPSESTFGNLKQVIANKIGLEPRVQRILYRGKEKDDDECLHIAGLQDMSKVILLEDPAIREAKSEEELMRKNIQDTNDAYEAVARVRSEVDKVSEKVVQMEKTMQNGGKIVEKEVLILTELLMMQLFKLDSIEANGNAREQRRTEVHRVQNFVDKLDALKKARKSKSDGISSNNCGNASKMGDLQYLEASTQIFKHGNHLTKVKDVS